MTLNLLQKGFMETIFLAAQGARKSRIYNITFEGVENLEKLSEGGIQLCNHQSMFDIPIEMLGIRETLGIGSFPYHVIRPMPFVESVGGLTVTRPKDIRKGKKPIRAGDVYRDKVIPLANGGDIITIFPEGTRKPIGTKTQLEGSKLRVLQSVLQEGEFERPIVPTCISYNGKPTMSRVIASVAYGEPIDTSDLEKMTQQLNDFYRRVQN